MIFGHDRYAAVALGTAADVEESIAGADVFVGKRGLAESVVPGIDNEILDVVGDDQAAVQAVRRVIFDRAASREVWAQPTLPMELREYVGQLVERGDLYIHLDFDRSDDEGLQTLTGTTWLAPETLMLRRGRGGRQHYEQFVSRHRFGGDAVVIDGEPEDRLLTIAVDDVLHLRWPLPVGAGSGGPAQDVKRLGQDAALHERRSLLNARAGAYYDDPFLPLARARTGAFADVLDQQKAVSARIKDMLAYPGAYEAEVFPWVDDVTDYFRADRILLSRISICRVRRYLFDEFNAQVLHRWCRRNGWSDVSLTLRADVFREDEWVDMRRGLADRTVSLGDIRAAVAAESEAARTLES